MSFREFPLPTPIGNIKTFTWGPVDAVHRLECLNAHIVEYFPEIFENSRGTGKRDKNPHFHPYINGKDSRRGFHTIEEAVIFCVASRTTKRPDDAAKYAAKTLDCDTN